MSEFDLDELSAGFRVAFERAKAQPGGAVLLCRHSIRGPIPLDPDLRDVPLLDAGHRLCEQLGAELGWPFERAWTSPMQRCRDSLDDYVRGAGRSRSVTIEPDTRIGAPGAFVYDGAQAWESYKTHRKYELIARVYDPDIEVPGFHPTPVGIARSFVGFIDWAAKSDGAPAIACTHDTIMAALLSWAFDRRWAKEAWPGFFEGMVLHFPTQALSGEVRVRVHYRGESCERVVPQLS